MGERYVGIERREGVRRERGGGGGEKGNRGRVGPKIF